MKKRIDDKKVMIIFYKTVIPGVLICIIGIFIYLQEFNSDEFLKPRSGSKTEYRALLAVLYELFGRLGTLCIMILIGLLVVTKGVIKLRKLY